MSSGKAKAFDVGIQNKFVNRTFMVDNLCLGH